MRDYDDFCRRVLRRRARSAANLLEQPLIRDSQRRPWKPRPPRRVSYSALPTTAPNRMLTLADKKRIILLRYGSLTDVSAVQMS